MAMGLTMIERECGEGFYLECDDCGETVGGFDYFDEAVEWRMDLDNGWKSIRDNHGQFRDVCKDCVEKLNENKPDLLGF